MVNGKNIKDYSQAERKQMFGIIYQDFPILIFVPIVVSELLRTKMFIQLKDETAPIKRKLSRYGSYVVDVEYFIERAMLSF